jgi:hypothetical protein
MHPAQYKCGGKGWEYIGEHSPDEIMNHIKTIHSERWSKYEFRTKYRTGFLNSTKTIPLLWIKNDWIRTVHHPPTIFRFTEFSEFFPIIEVIQKKIEEKGMKGVPIKAMIALLPAKSKIDTHIDQGDRLMLSHRFHWAIKTNPLVRIQVEKNSTNFSEGLIYEFNNAQKHSVHNLSEEDRIHFIVDILPESYLQYGVNYHDLSWDDYQTIGDVFVGGKNLTLNNPTNRPTPSS